MPRHKHDWQPQWGENLSGNKRVYQGMICQNGCGKLYKEPSAKKAASNRRNFVLGNLHRARANVHMIGELHYANDAHAGAIQEHVNQLRVSIGDLISEVATYYKEHPLT